MSMLNSVEKVLITPLRWIDNSKVMSRLADKASKTDKFDNILAYTTIGSIALKDGIGCYMYVNQSLHNEKIPKEKRSFVAALDLTNGGLMIGAQLLFFMLFKRMKIADKLFNKIFRKTFSQANIKAATTNIKARKINSDVLKTLKKPSEEISSEFAKKFEERKKLFASILDIASAAILAKRVVVPFIATPLAGWAKDKFIEKNAPKIEGEDNTLESAKDTQDSEKAEDLKSDSVPEFKGNILEHYKATNPQNDLKN